MQRLLRSGAIRPKLAISQPGDTYEQEADRLADHVMHIPAPAIQSSCAPVNGATACNRRERFAAKAQSRSG